MSDAPEQRLSLRDCDWSKVSIPKPSKTQARPQSGEVSDLDWAKLMVTGELIKKSSAQIMQTALLTYLNRNWPKHLERLHVVANRENIAIEQAFERILSGELEL